MKILSLFDGMACDNGYERKDYKKGFFMDRTLKLLASINNL